MDPNTALENARKLAGKIIDGVDSSTLAADDLADLAEELAEAFQALDTWLLRGGFKPEAWR